jgi:hypothetical protein
MHEYEIKISKSDFRADSGKTEKHQIIETGFRELNNYERGVIESCEKYGENIPRYIKIAENNKVPGRRPNYFWYVCPTEITDTVPVYAGLIHCKPYLKIVKPAPLLHKEKITTAMEKKILASFYHRYWKIRRERKAA